MTDHSRRRANLYNLNNQWTVPFNFQISQLFKIGGQPMQAFIGARYYAEKPANGPDWGVRFGLTFMFPK
jgi:hypothetical protein